MKLITAAAAPSPAAFIFKFPVSCTSTGPDFQRPLRLAPASSLYVVACALTFIFYIVLRNTSFLPMSFPMRQKERTHTCMPNSRVCIWYADTRTELLQNLTRPHYHQSRESVCKQRTLPSSSSSTSRSPTTDPSSMFLVRYPFRKKNGSEEGGATLVTPYSMAANPSFAQIQAERAFNGAFQFLGAEPRTSPRPHDPSDPSSNGSCHDHVAYSLGTVHHPRAFLVLFLLHLRAARVINKCGSF
jgi:hypothetical protein